MLIAMVWPATINASKIICRQKPIAVPIRTSCATTRPVASDSSKGWVGGSIGPTTTVIATANVSRTRFGTRCAPKIGATIMTPATRKNGQTVKPSSRVSIACSMSSGISMVTL